MWNLSRLFMLTDWNCTKIQGISDHQNFSETGYSLMDSKDDKIIITNLVTQMYIEQTVKLPEKRIRRKVNKIVKVKIYEK